MIPLNRRRRQNVEPCDFLKPTIRFFGILTSFVVVGVGVDISVHGYKSGVPILICSAIVLIFETKWIIVLFLQLIFTSDDNSPCLVECCKLCQIADGWRLSPPYFAFGTALILWPHNLWLCPIAGIKLIILAVLRLCTILKFSDSFKEEGLLPDTESEKNGFSDIVEDGFAELGHSIEDENPIDDAC